MSTSPAPSLPPLPLSVPRATALYIGALFGPGLLLLPGLAAQQAGPASIIAWVALLGLSAIFATVFAALGRKVPGAAGAAGYAAAGLGRRAAAMTRWWFLAGVIAGAPIVCLIGASYVTAMTGGGPLARAAVAAGLLLAVLGLALGGVRASTMAQLLLVVLLIAVVVTAVAGGARVPPGQLDPVRPARLAVRRPRRCHPDALVRRLGGGGPADRPAARGPAVPGHRHRVHRDRSALPGPGRGHDQLPRSRRGPVRTACRPAAAGHRPGRAGGGRRGRAGPHGRRGQRLHHRGDRDAARAHRRTQSDEAERSRPPASAVRSRPARHHRPGRPAADRPVRAAAGRHHRPGQRADRDVPVRLPQLHGVRGPHPGRAGPSGGRRRGAGGAHGPGLLRLAGPARRRRRRRGRRPGHAVRAPPDRLPSGGRRHRDVDRQLLVAA